jgi:hypothetical protein
MHRALVILAMLLGLADVDHTVHAREAAVTGADARVPTDRDGYTRFAAEKLRTMMRGRTVRITGPLTLMVGESQINLDRPFDACQRNPEDCITVTTSFLRNLAAMPEIDTMKPTRERLRLVVRPQDYVDQLTQLGTPQKPTTVVSRPLPGKLVVLCYFDFPTVMRPASKEDLQTLRLTAEEAFAIAARNMATELPAIPVGSTKGRSIGLLAESPYESSRLALHDQWAGIARSMNGRLLVAVPGADVVLFGEEVGPESVIAISKATREGYRLSERPISATVFRWTKTGWEVATP